MIREKDRFALKEIDSKITYSGYVAGIKDTSNVRLTIKGDFIHGFIMFNNEWWFIEPLKKFSPNANVNEFITYKTKDVLLEKHFEKDTVPGELEMHLPVNHPPVTKYMKNESESTGTGFIPIIATSNGETTVNLALIADLEFKFLIDAWSSSQLEWYVYQASAINLMNGIFAPLDVQFRITWQFLDLYNTTLRSTNSVTLLGQTRDFIHDYYGGNLNNPAIRRSWQTDIAHLTTGKDLDDELGGRAERPGWYGLSEHRSGLYYENILATTHEIGHNFNGIHAEADIWCKVHFIICWDYKRTIMHEKLTHDNVSYFSNGSRNRNHNNKQRIIDNIASRTPVPVPCVVCHIREN